MNKKDLLESIQNELSGRRDVTLSEADDFLNAVCRSIMKAVRDGEEVTLPSVGKFKKVARSERKGRNPSSGEEMTVPARNVVQFKVAKYFKDEIA